MLTAIKKLLRLGKIPNDSQTALHCAQVDSGDADDAGDSGDLNSLARQMLAQGRYALLMRPQIAANLSEEQFRPASGALETHMALTPEGEVLLLPAAAALEGGSLEGGDNDASVVWVDQVLLDRHPVTNREYHAFVASGGYSQMAIWDQEIWPAIFDFVDQSGCPGPRYWKNGRHAPGEENLPVVGVSWYEAAAYARWVGKRLPTDAEWVKAASWPVTLSPTNHVQRKFPWGESMQSERANLWGTGAGRIVPVDQYPQGVSVGGVYQLIGNVWEWTTGQFSAEPAGHETPNAQVLRNIRGGAFDTYFENQATCQFASGDSPMARKHNIGFRCSLSVCDLAAAAGPPEALDQLDQPQPQTALEELSV